MDIKTQEQIDRMIEAIESMATKEFAESAHSDLPFDLSFPLDDEHPDHARLVCEGLRLGLCESFEHSRVSASIEDSYYKVRIVR